MSERIVRRVIVHGRVQGVGFRDWTRHIARDRGIEVWVRNRRDGTVEAVFAGTSDSVARMVAACRNGPRGARVESIEEHDASEAEIALRGDKSFAVLPTA